MERPAAEKKPEGLKSTGFFIWILFECQMIAIFYAHLSARTCEHRIHLWKSQTPQYISTLFYYEFQSPLSPVFLSSCPFPVLSSSFLLSEPTKGPKIVICFQS